jgi:hypothetical protein
MMRRTLILLFASTLWLFLVTPPGQARNDRGTIYEQGRFDDPYSSTSDECGRLRFKIEGRARGRYVTYNVRGSDGQAFLQDNRYRFSETLTNPRNGKKMYVSGRGRFNERKARHVEGDVWQFFWVEMGRPFVVKNARRKIVLADHGTAVFRGRFDTLGDHQPGGRPISERVLRTRGSFPSLEPDFDFCHLVRRLIG